MGQPRETAGVLSADLQAILQDQKAVLERLKACLVRDYPPGARVRVRGLHKGKPHVTCGVIVSHHIDQDAVAVGVENERTARSRRFDVRFCEVTLMPPGKPLSAEEAATQAAVTAFMASEPSDGISEGA